MPFPIALRNYQLKALAGVPDVLDRLLAELSTEDPIWDRRPDPERFTLREILAHLADWEPIWLGRLQRTLNEEEPFLPGVDEGAVAIAHRYDETDPFESLARYRQGRSEVLAFLGALDEAAWDRKAEREFVGPLTIEGQAFYILSHDGYHLQQIAEWL